MRQLIFSDYFGRQISPVESVFYFPGISYAVADDIAALAVAEGVAVDAGTVVAPPAPVIEPAPSEPSSPVEAEVPTDGNG